MGTDIATATDAAFASRHSTGQTHRSRGIGPLSRRTGTPMQPLSGASAVTGIGRLLVPQRLTRCAARIRTGIYRTVVERRRNR